MTLEFIDHRRGPADKYSWVPPFDWSVGYENDGWWDDVRYHVDEPWFVQVLDDDAEVARVVLDDPGGINAEPVTKAILPHAEASWVNKAALLAQLRDLGALSAPCSSDDEVVDIGDGAQSGPRGAIQRRIRRDPGGLGWYFGDKLRENAVYTNVFVARVADLEGISASELQRVMRNEASAGCDDLRLDLSTDDEGYFDEEESPIEPISFCLINDALALSFTFSTDQWIWDEISALDPTDGQDDDEYFDEAAAGSQLLEEILAPLFERNRGRLIKVEANHHFRSPPWWWTAVAVMNTRGRKLDDLYRLGEDAIALIEAFGQSERLTQEMAVELLRAGHARALIGQSENQWLEVKSQNFDLDTGMGQIKLAQSIAKFANSEIGGLLVVGMAGKKISGGEIIQRVCPVPLNGRLVRRYQQAIEHRLYPPPDRLSIEPIGTGDFGLILIIVPAQPEELKPFLVHGAIVDGKEEGLFISIVRRRGEASISTTAPMIHSALAAGRALLRRGELPPEG